MTIDEFTEAASAGKITPVSPASSAPSSSPAQSAPTEATGGASAPQAAAPSGGTDITQFIPLLSALQSVQQWLSAAPTLVPQTFEEQIQFVYDGVTYYLYFYANNQWNALPVSIVLNKAAFGGDGSDGALTISSGTTTVDLGGAAVFVKNYSSISITGTGNLAFSNPNANGTIIILKCSGDCTITSSATNAIDMTSATGVYTGAPGGAAVVSSGGGSNVNGGCGGGGASATNPGGPGVGVNISSASNGKSGAIYGQWGYAIQTVAGAGLSQVGGGSVVGGTMTPFYLAPAYAKFQKLDIMPGGGGGSGGTGNSGSGFSSGRGGNGGGALYMEVAGAYHCTGHVNASGEGGLSVANGGGGGGGGGGSIVILYNSLVADTGTYTVSGGAGGTSGGSITAGAGGAGFALVALNTEFA